MRIMRAPIYLNWRGLASAGVLTSVALGSSGGFTTGCSSEFSTQPVVAPCSAPTAPVCTPNQICLESGTTARCECKAGFSGVNCTANCQDGQQDKDGDGVCKPACTPVKGGPAPCGAYATCDDTKGELACSCAPGYRITPPSKACEWGGVIVDPGFQGTPPSAWAFVNATPEPAFAADIDVGRVLIDADQILTSPATISQTITMPNIAQSQALALRVVAATNRKPGTIFGATTLLLRAGGRTLGQLPIFGGFIDEELCLGARWYGRKLDLSMSFSTSKRRFPFGGSFIQGPDVLLDRVNVQPTSKCPAPGQVVNGDFEVADGWLTSVSTTPGTLAETVAVAGLNGQRAGRLAVASGCDIPSLTTQISPLEDPSQAAISFNYRGSPNDFAEVLLSGARIARLSGSTAVRSARICLPEGVKGLTTPLSFRLSVRTNCITGGARDWGFDDVKLVADASCGKPHLIANSDFEGDSTNATTWIPNPIEKLVVSAPGDNSGKAGSISLSKVCESGSLESYVSVPSADASGGVALRFRARNVTPNPETVNLFVNLATGTSNLILGPTWQDRQVCIAPAFTGGAAALVMSANLTGPTCDVAANSRVEFDNFKFEADAACPKQ